MHPRILLLALLAAASLAADAAVAATHDGWQRDAAAQSLLAALATAQVGLLTLWICRRGGFPLTRVAAIGIACQFAARALAQGESAVEDEWLATLAGMAAIVAAVRCGAAGLFDGVAASSGGDGQGPPRRLSMIAAWLVAIGALGWLLSAIDAAQAPWPAIALYAAAGAAAVLLCAATVLHGGRRRERTAVAVAATVAAVAAIVAPACGEFATWTAAVWLISAASMTVVRVSASAAANERPVVSACEPQAI